MAVVRRNSKCEEFVVDSCRLGRRACGKHAHVICAVCDLISFDFLTMRSISRREVSPDGQIYSGVSSWRRRLLSSYVFRARSFVHTGVCFSR